MRSEAHDSRHIRCLTDMVKSFERDAQTYANSPDNRDVAWGHKLQDRAAAVKWIMERAGVSADLLSALEALEPYLDAIVCYASTMDEHEPNRLVFNARSAIAAAKEEEPKP